MFMGFIYTGQIQSRYGADTEQIQSRYRADTEQILRRYKKPFWIV